MVRRTEALTGDVIEVLSVSRAWVLRIFSALALALSVVPHREDDLT